MITSPNRFNPRELTIRARKSPSRTMNLGKIVSEERRRSVESYKFNGWELDINSRSPTARTASSINYRARVPSAMLHFCEKPRQNSVARSC